MMKQRVLLVAGACCALTTILSAQNVPALWNTSPWTGGAYYDSFNALPGWVPSSEGSVTNDTTATGLRFFQAAGTVSNQLSFATTGITNTLTGVTAFGGGNLIYTDMRCKFVPFDEAPAAEAGAYILRYFVNINSNFVVETSSQSVTNIGLVLSPDTYYQVKVEFGTNCAVYLDTALVATVATSASQLSKIVISGSGLMDDLYVGHGDPARSAANPVPPITLSAATTNEINTISNWLNSHKNNIAGQAISEATAIKYYLTAVEPAGTSEPTVTMTINSFNYIRSQNKVDVVVKLLVNGTPKQGAINGKIQLMGSTTANGTFAKIAEAKTVSFADFNAGLTAKYTFDLAAGNTYKFFKPVIVTE